MTLRKAVALILLAAGLLLAAGITLAQGGDAVASPRLVFTEHYVLSAGQTVAESLVVVARTITLEAGSVINGDAALVGQQVTVHGEVHGELAILADEVVLMESAELDGNVRLCSGQIYRARNIRLGGAYSVDCQQLGGLLSQVIPLALDPANWHWEADSANTILQTWHWSRLSDLEDLRPAGQLTPAERLLINTVLALTAGALASLFTLMIPRRLRRISEAALGAPLAAEGIGLLSLIILGAVTGLVVLSLVLLVTFCLVPLVGLAWVVLIVAMVIGWAAISLPVGVWFLDALGVRRINPLLAACLGGVLLTFGIGLLGISVWTMPLYALVAFLLGAWGLGAVVLTRFGGQAYPASGRIRASHAADPHGATSNMQGHSA